MIGAPPDPSARSARVAASGYALGGTAVLACLFAIEQGVYVNYAEGVYLYSARPILGGAVPYHDFVAAHPPLLFYVGAGLLAISDSLEGVRVVLSCLSLVTGALVCGATFRLTGSGRAAALAACSRWSPHGHFTNTRR